MTAEYWQRRNEEMKHIQDMFDSDAAYNAELKRLYARTQREIQKEIDGFLTRYAGSENITMIEVNKRVSKMDVEEFADKAKQYVKERNFSDESNRQLKVYNLKMKINRLELLNEHIRLETIAMANDEERLLTARLNKEVYDEFVRQSGILGESVPSVVQLDNLARQIVSADFKGTNFSNRVWTNQKELQSELENAIRRTIIKGENPRVAARGLRKLVNDNVKNKRYAAERLAITESGRVQVSTQIASYKEYDIDQLIIICEPSACNQCKPHDDEVVNVSEAEQGVSVPIFHPNCRCSTSSFVSRKLWDDDLKARGL